MVAPRSPTPTAGGSIPPGPAHTRRTTSPDTSTLTTAEASSSGSFPLWPRMGRSRHGAQLAVNQPSFRQRGFDSSPAHDRVTPDRWGTGPRGRARGRRRQPPKLRGKGPSSRRRGCESRRWRHVDVAQGTKAPAHEAGECRFKPCRRHQSQLAVARVDEHRRFSFRVPGLRRRGRTFESCRRGAEVGEGSDPAG